MTRVFVLADDMSSSDAATQLTLTLPALRDRFELRVGVLGELGTASTSLRDAGIPVQRLPFRHAIDLGGLKQLRKATAGSDVLHAVGPLAVRLSQCLSVPRVVASAAAEGSGLFGRLTDRALRAARRVLAGSELEAAEYRRRGIPEDRIAWVPLAAPPTPSAADAVAVRRSLGVPADARLIMTAGPLVAATGLRDAVWAFDGFRHESHDLRLVIVGAGPERERLDAFGRAIGYDDYRIHFAEERPDLPAVLALAEVVWVTAMRGSGVALAAMAAGRPIVAWQGSEAAELIRNGESGMLVPRNDRIALASKTVTLVNDAGLAARLGSAGRAIAGEHEPRRAAAAIAAEYSSV